MWIVRLKLRPPHTFVVVPTSDCVLGLGSIVTTQIDADLNDIPLRYVNGAMVYMRDVASVHDGYSPPEGTGGLGASHTT